jgi:hypothetical protein
VPTDEKLADIQAEERDLLRHEVETQRREAAQRETRDRQVEELKNRVSVAAIVLTTALTFIGNVRANREEAASSASAASNAARQQGADAWNYYQGKLAERTELEVARDRMVSELAAHEHDPNKDVNSSKLEELHLSEYRSRIREFDREAQLVFLHVQSLEAESDVQARKAYEPKKAIGRYELGSKVVTLALILLSVTILSNRHWLFWAGISLGGLGLVVALDGYFLFV